MKSRISLITVVICIVFSLILVACQPAAAPATSAATKAPVPNQPAATNPPATNPPANSQSQPVELTYFYRVTAPDQEANLKAIIEGFNQKFTGKIHVTGSGVDDTTYKTKLDVFLRSDNPPDVFYSWEGGRAQALIDAGYSLPLDTYYSQYGWDKILSPAGISLATIEGKKYFVPYQMSSAVIWYRPDIFQKYNLTVPKTWADMQKIVTTLKANNIAPFLTTDKETWEAQFEWSAIMVNKHGLQAYQDLMNNKIPWTDPMVVDTTTTFKQMIDDGWYHSGILSMGLADGAVPFGKGEAAMWYQGNWLDGTLKGSNSTVPYPLGFFTWPQMDASITPTMEVFCENTLMINAKSKNPDAAAAFLDYFVSTPVQEMTLYNAGGTFPANTQVDLSKLPSVDQDLYKLMQQAGGYTYMHIDHGFLPEIANKFLIDLQGVIGGNITPADMSKDVEAVAVTVRGPVK